MNSTTTAFTQETRINAFGRPSTAAYSQFVYALREEPPDWLKDTIASIRELRNLRPNWDSYGARSVDRSAVDMAERMVSELARWVGIPGPCVTATGEGWVGLCWDIGSYSLDASVDGSGNVSYVFLDEKDHRNDHEDRTSDLTPLVAYLTRIP